ncbi:hypothetical protein [Pseudarthrobacter cellobiosi]|uniref:hypothetical protein n=1 Tax=Pseudarthrobacter cellobiosi TaxID=2953654 RepID=UPI00208FA061|nr:hypothetical protein [Pseudarthrobacter sp. HLT1-5]MCO4254464.1 hypothetical protein [Pseudarthrobacter sp. HLT1-5]
MRSRTWMVTLATAGLLAAGAAAPAYAAEGTAPAASSAPAAERAAASGRDGAPDMGRMHEQMMKGMRDMASMEEMMQRIPGLAKMCEKMMTDSASEGTSQI